MLKLKIVNKSENDLPKYATVGDSGMDLRADIPEDITLEPLERLTFPTGNFIDLPEGFEAQVRPRSGLASKHGITVLNAPGTVDSSYKGEIKVILVNLSNEAYTIKKGMRIAQMVIARYTTVELEEVDVIEINTERGSNGIGHTGTD